MDVQKHDALGLQHTSLLSQKEFSENKSIH